MANLIHPQSSQLKLAERVELLCSKAEAVKREITHDLKINFKATTVDPETKQITSYSAKSDYIADKFAAIKASILENQKKANKESDNTDSDDTQKDIKYLTDNEFNDYVELQGILLKTKLGKYFFDWKQSQIENGYKYEFIDQVANLIPQVNFNDIIRNIIYTAKNKTSSLYVIAGACLVPQLRDIDTKAKAHRCAVWCTGIMNTLISMKFMKLKENGIRVPDSVIAKRTADSQASDLLTEVVLNIPEYHSEKLFISIPNGKPKHSKKVLGNMWTRDGNELDHCSETMELSDNIPLQYSTRVFDLLKGEFHLTDATEEKWDPEKFDTFEEYVEARKLAFNNYISKIPAVIKEMLGVVFYNTYEDDSRGRTYPTNSAANYVGIKEIRALISFANGESIGTLNKKALEDIFLNK